MKSLLLFALSLFAFLWCALPTASAQSGLIHIKQGPIQPVAGGGTQFSKIQLPQGSPPWSWIKGCTATSVNGVSGPLDTAANYVVFNVPVFSGPLFVNIICEAETLTKFEAFPPSIALSGFGQKAQIQVRGTFKNGTIQALSHATDGTTYTSSDPKIATVTADGQVQVVGQGKVTINIKNGSFSDTVSVDAKLGPVLGLFLSPAVARFDKAGQQQPVQVSLLYASGIRRDISAQATFSSARTTVASITGQTVTAVGSGRSTITVRAAGLTATMLAIVDGTAQLLSLKATPNPVSLKFKGTTAQLTVIGTYSDNSTLDLTKGASGIVYKSSNPAVAKVSVDGEVEAVSSGNAVITIEHPAGKKPKTTVNATVTVPTLSRLEVTPNPLRLKKIGDKSQFAVVARYSDNSTQDVTTSKLTTYTSGDTSVATVTTGGEVAAVKLGQTDITIKHDTQTVKVPVQIAAKLVQSLAFARGSVSMVQNNLDTAGVTTQLELTATFDDNSTGDVTGDADTSYQSSNTSVATVTAKGEVFAATSAGTTTITATHKGKQATISVTITRFAFRTVVKLDLKGTMEDVAVVNGTAYVAAGSEGIHIVDVSDPTKPAFLRTISLSDNAVFVRSWGDELLVADRKGGLYTIAAHDPAIADVTRQLTLPGTDGEAYGAAHWRNRLFVAGGKAGVVVYDMTQMNAPKELGATATGEALSVDTDGRWLAVVDKDRILFYDRQRASWWGSAPSRIVALVGARKIIASGSATLGTFYVAAADGVHRVNEQGQKAKLSTGTIAIKSADVAREPGWLMSSGEGNGIGDAPTYFIMSNPLNPVYRGFQSFANLGSLMDGKGLDAQGGYLFVASDNRSQKHMLKIGQYRRWVDYDVKAPTVSLTYPLDNSTQSEDKDLHFVVQASDDREVTKVEFRIGSQVIATRTTRPFVLSYPAPQVTGTTPFVLDVIAYDPAGNKTTSQAVTVNVTSITDTTKPTITLERPANGEEAEIGKPLFIVTTPKDDKRVQRVDFYVDGTKVGTALRPPYVYRYVVPSSTADGTALKIRADVVDYGGQQVQSTESTITAVKLTELTADISATDRSKDNQRVVIRGRTIKIDGVHNFKSLWIDQSGVLQHSAATTSTSFQIDIKADYVKVDASSKIDVSGLGYLAAQASGNGSVGRTINNGTTGGAKLAQGGAHGGPGGYGRSTAPAPASFDSLFDPRYPGGGSGQPNATTPPNGGGVVRIDAKVMRLDGMLTADGAGKDSFSPGGAGGSVLLKVPALLGDGEIHADGGGGRLSSVAGGGGRIAIYTNDFNRFDQSNITAFGHEAIASSPRDTYFCGGAGSVYLKTANQTYGTLIIDNGSPPNNIQVTPLPQVGKSTSTGLTRNTITNTNAAWEVGQLVGHYVNPNIQQNKSYRITANTANTLTLDVGSDDLTVIAKSGDTYHGVLFLDQLIVRGRAVISTADQLRVGSGGVTLRQASLTSGTLQLDANSDATLDQSTLTLTQPLQVRNLRLTNGSTLTVPAGTIAGVTPLQITVSQTFSMDAQSKIELQGKGYVQGNAGSSGSGYHYKNSNVGGANFGAGGSHGGTGEVNAARYPTTSKTNAPYGNLFAPIEAGAGGGCLGGFTCKTGAGGGAVRIQADTVELNGTINVNGEEGSSGGSGAGGSVYITTRLMSGGGSISANGGKAPQFGSHGAGGGGRVSIHYTTLSGFDPAQQITAYAGVRVHPTNPPAGAGTIFTKAASETYGQLLIDHNNQPLPNSGFVTVLPSVGEGTITALTASLLTNTAASFAADDQLAGLWIKADATKANLYRVMGNTATSLSTRASDGDMTLISAVGRTYRGVLRLDKLTLKGKARVSTLDELSATTTQVPNDAAFQAQNVKLPACPGTCGANLDCQVFGCGNKTTCLSSSCQ